MGFIHRGPKYLQSLPSASSCQLALKNPVAAKWYFQEADKSWPTTPLLRKATDERTRTYGFGLIPHQRCFFTYQALPFYQAGCGETTKCLIALP